MSLFGIYGLSTRSMTNASRSKPPNHGCANISSAPMRPSRFFGSFAISSDAERRSNEKQRDVVLVYEMRSVRRSFMLDSVPLLSTVRGSSHEGAWNMTHEGRQCTALTKKTQPHTGHRGRSHCATPWRPTPILTCAEVHGQGIEVSCRILGFHLQCRLVHAFLLRGGRRKAATSQQELCGTRSTSCSILAPRFTQNMSNPLPPYAVHCRFGCWSKIRNF